VRARAYLALIELRARTFRHGKSPKIAENPTCVSPPPLDKDHYFAVKQRVLLARHLSGGVAHFKGDWSPVDVDDDVVGVDGRRDILGGITVRRVAHDQARFTHGSVSEEHALDFRARIGPVALQVGRALGRTGIGAVAVGDSLPVGGVEPFLSVKIGVGTLMRRHGCSVLSLRQLEHSSTSVEISLLVTHLYQIMFDKQSLQVSVYFEQTVYIQSLFFNQKSKLIISKKNKK
jgi:hypothetical protein